MNDFVESCSRPAEKFSLCLAAIVSGGPAVRNLFHEQHVKDSTRLRGGVRVKY